MMNAPPKARIMDKLFIARSPKISRANPPISATINNAKPVNIIYKSSIFLATIIHRGESSEKSPKS
jgi:hypothetical protein